MNRLRRVIVLLAVIGYGFVAASSAIAQSPAEGELLANRSEIASFQSPFDLACDKADVCLITWLSLIYPNGPFNPGTPFGRLGATTISPLGVLKEKILRPSDTPSFGYIVPGEREFTLYWNRHVQEEPFLVQAPVFQVFDENLSSRSALTYPTEPSNAGTLAVAAVPGGLVALVGGDDIGAPDFSEGVHLTRISATGARLGPDVRVNSVAAGTQRTGAAALTADPNSHDLTVLFEEFLDEADYNSFESQDIFLRRFTAAGDPLTGDIRVNSFVAGVQGGATLASAPTGEFVAVWMSADQDGSRTGVFGQRFTRHGIATGQEFAVNLETLSDQAFPRIAVDRRGNFAIAWQSFIPESSGLVLWDIKARLFRASGTPVGPEIFVNRHRQLEQTAPRIAFAANGIFVVAWRSNAQLPPAIVNFSDVFARRFSASPADEPCIASAGVFSCDTGRTGGSFEVQHSFGGASAGPGLLGDVDGDGREDPCDYTGGSFRCDTDHEGGQAEISIPFAIAGRGVPLLGDMDGDGRADPCLARAGRISCDLAHNGGAPELDFAFGQSGETLLLGDLDGDRRAEACGFAAGYFRCDTAHNGGVGELIIAFGKKKDVALLGDFDGDGRDDPCVFRKGKLLCDTAHDGGNAEGSLALASSGGRVLLGNLDGL